MNIDSIEQALTELGVSEDSLGSLHRAALDERGWLVLKNAIDPIVLERMREAFENACGGNRNGKETGTRHPTELLDRDAVFTAVVTQPALLAAIYHILQRPFRLSQFSGRDPLPGFGQQGLHADWVARSPRDPYAVVTALWMLDDFTRDNGATRIVPGTHRQVNPVPKAMADPAAHHPQEIIVTGEAGSILVFNGHLWHSGTRNQSKQSRRALQCVYWGRELFPPYAQPLCAAVEGFSPAVRYFLGA